MKEKLLQLNYAIGNQYEELRGNQTGEIHILFKIICYFAKKKISSENIF